MLEVLQFYVSGFWTWIGLTIALGIIASAAGDMVRAAIYALRQKTPRTPS